MGRDQILPLKDDGVSWGDKFTKQLLTIQSKKEIKYCSSSSLEETQGLEPTQETLRDDPTSNPRSYDQTLQDRDRYFKGMNPAKGKKSRWAWWQPWPTTGFISVNGGSHHVVLSTATEDHELNHQIFWLFIIMWKSIIIRKIKICFWGICN